MTVGTLPPSPARTMEPATFAATADTFVAALPTLVSDINTTVTSINASQTAAAGSAAAASSSQTAASTSASNAAASATAAASAASAAAWVNGNTYALNASAISQVNFQTYRKKTASSVTTVDPASDGTNWAPIGRQTATVSRSSNTDILEADYGTTFLLTGTFTQVWGGATGQVTSNGWWCIIKNNGSGDITINPNSPRLVDGLTGYIMYPGEVRRFSYDGTNLTSIILQPFYRVWTTTASNNFTKPPGYNYFEGLAWSGGASGAKQPSGTAALGGGGGGCFPFKLRASDLSTTETITIGAGGAARTTNGGGNSGGETSIGSRLFIAGASSNQGGSVAAYSGGSATTSASTSYGVGFEAGVGTIDNDRGSVYGGAASSTNGNDLNVNSIGRSIYGAAHGGSLNASNLTQGVPTSLYGGAGGAASAASNGTDGTIPGGGGGATQTGTQSGAGARGEVRMWGVC